MAGRHARNPKQWKSESPTRLLLPARINAQIKRENMLLARRLIGMINATLDRDSASQEITVRPFTPHFK